MGMMPKEKAKELVNKSMPLARDQDGDNKALAKKIALLCVNEIELYRRQIEEEYDEDLYHAYGVEEYWQEVKREITLL